MLSKLASITLAITMSTIIGVNPIYAASQDETHARATANVRQRIQARGVGEKVRIEAVLHDGTKLKGYISEAGEDGFVIVVANSGAPTRVAYSQVKQVKGRGRSTGAKILIGLGIAAGVLLLIDLIVDD